MPLLPDTTDSSDRPTPGLRTYLRSTLRVAAGVLAGLWIFVIAVVLFVLLLLQIPYFASPAAQLALSLANPWTGTTATVGSAGGTWLTDLALREVRISNEDGSLVIAIDSLGASYDLVALLSGELKFRSIRLVRPIVITGTSGGGDLELLHPFRSEPDPEADTSGGLRVTAGLVQVVGGGFFLHPGRDSNATTLDVSDILIAARNVSIGDTISLVLDTVSAVYRPRPDTPDPLQIDAAGELAGDLITVRTLRARSSRTDVRGSGTISLHFDTLFTPVPTSFRLNASPLAYADIHPFVPSVGPEGRASVDVTLARDARSAAATAACSFPGGGTVELSFSAEARENLPPSVRADVRAADMNTAALTGTSDPSELITLRARVDGIGPSPSSFTGRLTAGIDARGLVGRRTLRATVDAALNDGAASLNASGTLDALLFDIHGSLNAFSDPPMYDLTAGARIPPDGGGPIREDIFDRLEGLRGTVRASGTGFDPLTGTSRATVRAEWDGNPDLESLLLDASSADSVVTVTGVITTFEGYLRLDARADGRVHGSADGGTGRSLTLKALEFSRLDLSALVGTQGSMSLTGSASGSVGGTNLSSMNGALEIRLDSSVVGSTRIAHAELRARAENGMVRAAIEGHSSDGAIRLRASGEPFAERPSVAVQEARFEGLDLGGLFLGDDGASDLNGSARVRLVMEPGPPSAGPGGKATGRRNGPIGILGEVQVDFDRSRVYRQTVESGSVVVELAGQTAAVGLDLRTPEGGVMLTGGVAPFEEFPDVRLSSGRFERLNLGALAGIDSLDTDLSGSLSADVQGRSWETATGSVSLELLPSRINLETLRDARLTADFMRGDVSLLGYASPGAGAITLAGSGSYRDDLLMFNAEVDADIRDLSRLLRDTTLAGSNARVSIATRGTWGPPEATRIDGRLYAAGTLDSLRLDSLIAIVAVAGRAIVVDSLVARSNAGEMRGRGTIAAFDSTGGSSSDFALTASLRSPHLLRRITGLAFSRTGTSSLTAGLTGTGRDGTLDASVSMANLGVEDMLVPSLAARATMRLGAGPRFESIAGQAFAGDVAIGELVIDSVVAAARTDGTVSSFSASLDLEAGDRIVGAGTAERSGVGYVVTLDTFQLVVDDRSWTLEKRAQITFGDGVSIDDLSLASGSRHISAHGALRPKGEQDFVLQIDSLSFDRLARIMRRPGLGGTMSFSGLVTGPAERARATGRFTASMLSDGMPLGKVESELDWAGGIMKLTSSVTQPDQSSLRAVVSLPASLPVVSGGTATGDAVVGREFALQTDGFDLGFFQPFLGNEVVSGLRGLLTADLTLGGRSGAFSGTGRLGIDTAYARINTLGLEYSGVRLRASLDGPVLTIDTLSARTGTGRMAAAGTISLARLEDPAFDLRVVLDKFVGINRQTIRAVADGGIELAGTLTRPVITGNVRFDEANFVIPESAGGGQVESVELTDSDYAMLRERFGYRRPASRAGGAGDTTRVSLDVDLQFPRRAWIRKKSNPSLSIEIEGGLKVRSVPGEPLTINGTLKPVAGRSYVSQFGRQFEIKSGEIRFSGPPEQFDMNVDSEYKVPARSGSGLSEATIRMTVRRRLERFEFDLSSDPPMEQPDILSYLTTGTATTGAFASTSSQGNLATSAALEQVVGAIGGLTEDKIPLDIFQIRQDGARGITIVAGNYVTPKTYVGVRYPIVLQQTGQDSYYDTGTEFEVEYQSYPWLFWNAKGGSTRLLLLLKSRYAY